ncbi:MAG TPA: hypothetical protein VGM19_14985 [Armatimonadota bacterium]|jgi:opacity protein-like surface antigen
MTKYSLCLSVVLTLVVAVGAFATPSTLIWIPSTDIQADKTWHLGLDNYVVAHNAGVTSSPTYDLGPEYGFAGGRAEAGIDYITGFSDPLFFNAKYKLLAEKGGVPTLVVGGFGFGTKQDKTDYNMVYLLGSKTFAPVRLTLGYCHGNKAALGTDENMLMAGIDGNLSKKWWAAVDYQSGQNVWGALNAGVSYNFADNVSVIFGYDWYNSSALKDTFTTQLDINF